MNRQTLDQLTKIQSQLNSFLGRSDEETEQLEKFFADLEFKILQTLQSTIDDHLKDLAAVGLVNAQPNDLRTYLALERPLSIKYVFTASEVKFMSDRNTSNRGMTELLSQFLLRGPIYQLFITLGVDSDISFGNQIHGSEGRKEHYVSFNIQLNHLIDTLPQIIQRNVEAMRTVEQHAMITAIHEKVLKG